MSNRRRCLECLQGLRKNDQQELIDNEAYMKSADYFTYNELICNGCAKFLVSEHGDYAGAPIRSVKYVIFLDNHFKNLYYRIKRDMPKDKETESKWKLAIDNRNKFTANTMTKLHNNPSSVIQVLSEISDNIYNLVVGKELIYQNNMLIGDIMTGHPYKKRK